MSYDFSDYFGVAVRGDYFGDEDGARTSGAPFTAPFAANTRQKLGSLTLTLNIKPVEHLEIRPEFRWDHSSADLFSNRTGNSRENQFTFAIGMAYSL